MTSTDEIRFAEWQIWPQLRILLHRGKPVKISGRAFDVLVVLVSAKGQVVSKDSLLAQVWGNEIVEENNLQAQISAIRRVLGHDRHLLVTEFGFGYRFNCTSKPPMMSSDPTRLSPVTFPFLTSILGRDQAVLDICALIRQHPLVTITGPGGVGKTRLAWEVVNLLQTQYPDGICVAELAHITDASSLFSVFSQVLHLPLAAVHNSHDLSHQLAQRRCLLMIDNGEHVINELKPIIAMLLNAAPHIAMLLTSQVAVELAGEQQYRLPPLKVPEKPGGNVKSLQTLPSVRLFIERGRDRHFDFHPSDSELSLIGELCRHLDGLPLAIELAASRLPVMSVSEIYHCLEDRFQLLSNMQSARVSRHQKIKTTLEWTYQLLNPREQKLFCSLGIFTDMFTVNAVTEFLQPPEETGWQIVDDLQRLLSLSMIQVSTQVPVTRFRLLETLRQFACDKLRQQGEYPRLSSRFADYCHRQAEQAQLDWNRLPTEQWRERYDPILNDLRSVLQQTLTEGVDHVKGLEILQAMTPFWIEYSLYNECQRHISPLLSEVRSQVVLTLRQRMNLSAAAGKASTWAKGPIPETCSAWQTALMLADQLNDNEIRLQAHYGLWLYYLRIGKLDISLHHAQSMCTLARAIDDAVALATGLRIVGVSYHFLGQHSLGRDYLQQSLNRFALEDSGRSFRFGLDQETAGEAFLSRVLWVQGEYKAAKRMAWSAVKKAARLKHICSLCCALAEGACMTAALDRNPRWVIMASDWLITLAEKHNLYFWKTYGELFLRWAEQLTHPEVRQTKLFSSLQAMGLDWQYSPLLSEMDSGLSQKKPHENWCIPELMRLSSMHLPAHSQRKQLEQALEKAHKQQAYGWELRIACSLARLHAETGDSVTAKQLLIDALSHIDGSQHAADVQNALELCARLGG
ncbi:winged helix-turn-helix domain-containing protein [Citrobacter portucalensis]|uniref:winged helix-turn-helix domain-containing protein n=1 Tax=Citrobacter portucalensis TaxID=1639133 RepID=UPI001E58B9AA|nr:winged helix-turn-helix domain-containing protein [Citrobacter portucalensis]UHD38526.1 winged helix-turn-helix domain-containing protein [Citrobacter portucalensis]